ncbi:MAG: Rieske (2Fe-2S) protein [Bacteroidetes bacterium]|nr:Rieske (2Fe-2S) protein [Bacteroidota bacterium]
MLIDIKNNQFQKSGTLTESRRQFIEKAGLAAVIGTFGISFFTSCVSSDEPINPATPPPNTTAPNGITVSGSVVKIDLTIQTRLATAGGWLLIESAKTLVANLNGNFVALTSVCTHSGCFDRWAFANNRFTCTCHNSIFDTAGAVLQGPAAQPLVAYSTSVSGTTLTVTK